MSPRPEVQVIINGVTLSSPQVMAVRVALAAFLDSMNQEGLGEDEHGVAMSDLYAQRSLEVLKIIHRIKEVPPP